jgi:hypothetical protein
MAWGRKGQDNPQKQLWQFSREFIVATKRKKIIATNRKRRGITNHNHKLYLDYKKEKLANL